MARINRLIVLSVCALLASCGGGGGDSDAGNASHTSEGPTPTADLTGRLGVLALESVRTALTNVAWETDQIVTAFGGGPLPKLDLTNGPQTVSCPISGTQTSTVEEGGKFITIDDSACKAVSDFATTGSFTVRFSNIDEVQQKFDSDFAFADLRSVFADGSSTLNGSDSIHTEIHNGRDTHEVSLDETLQSISGTLNTTNLKGTVVHIPNDFSGVAVTNTHGTIKIGRSLTRVEYLPTTRQIHLLGSNGTEVFAKLDGTTYSLRYTDEKGAIQSVAINEQYVPKLSPADGINSAPVFANVPAILTIAIGDTTTADFSRGLYDPDLEPIQTSLVLSSSPSDPPLSISPIGNAAFSIKAIKGGEFTLTLTATDPSGLATSQDITIVVTVDTDNDGIENRFDTDDDNDGVADDSDAFPLDPTRSLDTDHDRIGNRDDTDDDGDGVADGSDAYPVDSACSQASAGESGKCFLTLIRDFDQAFSDETGIIYFVTNATKTVYRWDSTTASFDTSWHLGTAVLPGSVMTTSAFVPNQQRIYFGYDNGSVTYQNTYATSEQPFVTVSSAVAGLADGGNVVLILEEGTNYPISRTFDTNGKLLSSTSASHSHTFAFNTNNHYIYFIDDDISPPTLRFDAVDALSGKIWTTGESSEYDPVSVAPPIVTSPTGDRVLLGSGSILNANDLTWEKALPNEFSAAQWSASDGLVTLREQGDKALLTRRNAALKIVEQRLFNGTPRAIERTPNGYEVITSTADHLSIQSYKPNDDTDGDGVANTSDAFPTDPAASLDTDYDDYPDAWNTGATEADSSTNLILDAYPMSSACQIASQGNGTECVVVSTIPAYQPDIITEDDKGIVYLLSKANDRIYRYAATPATHLAPILVGGRGSDTAPTTMEYSPEHARLYLGYDSGAVTYVDLTAAQPHEEPFVVVPGKVQGLGAAGNFLLVQDDKGPQATHYYFDRTGILRSHAMWNYYSTDYAWDASVFRLFFSETVCHLTIFSLSRFPQMAR